MNSVCEICPKSADVLLEITVLKKVRKCIRILFVHSEFKALPIPTQKAKVFFWEKGNFAYK